MAKNVKTNKKKAGATDKKDTQVIKLTDEEYEKICKDAAEAISVAKQRLITGQPWYGASALRLVYKQDITMPTAATDGTYFYYNPWWIMQLKPLEVEAIVAHETGHVALRHLWRKKGRDHDLFNQACDFSINQNLIEDGFILPEGCLYDERFHGMSSEQIYAILLKEQQSGGGKGKGNAGSGYGGYYSSGEFGDPNAGTGGDPDVTPMSERDWEIAAEQADAMAKAAGRQSLGASRELQKTKKTTTDWKSHLRQFLTNTLPSDYTWAQPNKRYIANGLYMPGTLRENMPEIVIAIDTSGSIGPKELKLFGDELNSIMQDCRPERVVVIYCDAEINHIETFDPNDGEDLVLHPKGGGGTAFKPIFDWVEQSDNPSPACVIYFTDLYGDTNFPQPEYPCMWVLSEEYASQEPPWGEKLVISSFEDN